MNPTLLTIGGVVLAAAALGWLLRTVTSRSEDEITLEGGQLPPIGEVFDDEDDLDPDAVIALTSEGIAFIPAAHGVHLVPPGDTRDACAPGDLGTSRDEVTLAARGAQFVNPKTGGVLASCRPKETIAAGDLVGLRVKRGAPDHDPWRLEAIGRDGEFRAWRFETREAADAAASIVEPILRERRDDYGDPKPVTDADFEEAIRQEAMIEAEFGRPMEPFGEDEERRV